MQNLSTHIQHHCSEILPARCPHGNYADEIRSYISGWIPTENITRTEIHKHVYEYNIPRMTAPSVIHSSFCFKPLDTRLGI